MSSNYPPGHPTGVARGDEGEIFLCDTCGTWLDRKDLNTMGHCGICNSPVDRAQCEYDGCKNPATRLDCDRAVNYYAPYCASHYLGMPARRKTNA